MRRFMNTYGVIILLTAAVTALGLEATEAPGEKKPRRLSLELVQAVDTVSTFEARWQRHPQNPAPAFFSRWNTTSGLGEDTELEQVTFDEVRGDTSRVETFCVSTVRASDLAQSSDLCVDYTVVQRPEVEPFPPDSVVVDTIAAIETRYREDIAWAPMEGAIFIRRSSVPTEIWGWSVHDSANAEILGRDSTYLVVEVTWAPEESRPMFLRSDSVSGWTIDGVPFTPPLDVLALEAGEHEVCARPTGCDSFVVQG